MKHSASADRKAMISALQHAVVPALREAGFAGSFPHFRRVVGSETQLVSFHFSKWGGSFLLELARTDVSDSSQRASEATSGRRARLQASSARQRETWFAYAPSLAFWRNASRFTRTGELVLAAWPDAEHWYRTGEERGKVQSLGLSLPANNSSKPTPLRGAA